MNMVISTIEVKLLAVNQPVRELFEVSTRE